ncbi:MAG: dynamin family protein [Limnochordales bacterium]|nr:dynamin family protein [Limnochordales bacterium]
MQLLAKAERRYQRDEIIVPVVGHFSAGKSTFVNTLLGQDIQAVGPQPTTDSFTEIRGVGPRSHELMCYVRQAWTEISTRFARNRDWPSDVLQARYSELLAEEAGSSPAPPVRRVYTDNPEWPHGLVLVDTPGLEAADEQYDAATWRYIEDADACIYFITVTSPLTEADRRAVVQLATVVPRILVVLSKADMVDTDELQQVKHYVTVTLGQWLGEAGTPPQVVAISCQPTAESEPRQAGENSLAARQVVNWIKEEVILQRAKLRAHKLELDLQRAGRKMRATLAACQQAELNRCRAALAANMAKHEQVAWDADRYRSMLAVLDSRLDLFERARAQTLPAECNKLAGDILGSLTTWLSRENWFNSQRLIAHVSHLLDTCVNDFYYRLAASLQADAQPLLEDFPCEVKLPPVTIPDLKGRYKFASEPPIIVPTHTSGASGAFWGGLIGMVLLGPLGAIAGAIIGNSLASQERDWRGEVVDIVGARLQPTLTNIHNDAVQLVAEYIASIKSQAANAVAPVLTAETQTAARVQAAQVNLKRTQEYWICKSSQLDSALNAAQALINELLVSTQGGITT